MRHSSAMNSSDPAPPSGKSTSASRFFLSSAASRRRVRAALLIDFTEFNVRLGRVQLFDFDALDGRMGADRHEDGRFDCAVGEGEGAAPRGAVGREQLEFHGDAAGR